MTVSAWRAERNRRALARLRRGLPAIFPAPRADARARALVHAPDAAAGDRSYWRAHPVRADRLARVARRPERSARGLDLAARRGRRACRRAFAVRRRRTARPNSRAARASAASAGNRSTASAGTSTCGSADPTQCRLAHRLRGGVALWNAPSGYIGLLKRLQSRRCATTGERLWKTAEVDHRVPLFRVWGERRDDAWPSLLAYWGFPNLQVINRDVHVEKCASEATIEVGAGPRQAPRRRVRSSRIGVFWALPRSRDATTDSSRQHDSGGRGATDPSVHQAAVRRVTHPTAPLSFKHRPPWPGLIAATAGMSPSRQAAPRCGSAARRRSLAAAGRDAAARPGWLRAACRARAEHGRDKQPARIGVRRVADHLAQRAALHDPARHTSRRSGREISTATPMSWVTKITAMPNSRCSSRSSSRIWICTVASSAVVGSSASRTLGWHDSASAIIARCRMPPDISCG